MYKNQKIGMCIFSACGMLYFNQSINHFYKSILRAAKAAVRIFRVRSMLYKKPQLNKAGSSDE